LPNWNPGRSQIDPVFIVGMNGSGTTLLLHSLARHSKIYGFPGESQIIPRFIRKLPSYGNLAMDANYLSLWNDIRTAYPFRRYNDGAAVPLPKDWRNLERSLATVFDGVFSYFAEAQGKDRWCEKTPMHAVHIEALATTFPSPKVLHVIRDGRDCAISLKRRMRYEPELTIYRWKRVVRNAREQGSRIGNRYMELRYEDVTAEPAACLRAVCEFIGEAFENQVASPESDRDVVNRDYHIVKRGPIVNDGLRWPTDLSAAEITRLDHIGGVLLHELGYPVGPSAGDAVPSRADRAKMALAGYGGEAIRGIKRLLGNSQVPILDRVRTLAGRGWTQVRWWITNRRAA
jgi:hypothetical protein